MWHGLVYITNPCSSFANAQAVKMGTFWKGANWYIVALVFVALGLLGSVLPATTFALHHHLVLAGILSGLGMVAFLFPLRVSSETILSLHTSVLFTATLLFEPGLAMLVAGSVPLLAQVIRQKLWEETLFSVAQFMLQVGVSGLILTWANENVGTLTFERPATLILVVLVAVVMHTIERVALAIVISLEERRSLFELLRGLVYVNIELVSQFALGLLGAIIADVSIWALPLLIPPLVVIYRSNQRQVQLRKQAQDLEYQAFHDPMTGLPNRALFLDRVQHALHRAAHGQHRVAVLFLDLDQFKYINDSLGHDAGDQLLQGVAQRLGGCVRPADTVARLGGDEFTLLLEDVEPAAQATAVADRIKDALQAPFAVAGQALFVSASIGITLSDGQHVGPNDLMRQADAAMYKAKEHGRACYQVFDASKDAQVMTRLQLETELRHALERQEFVVHYQPLVDLANDTIIGFEALVRWQHPKHGLVPPGQFIPLAEDTGLILPLGQLVLRTACQHARAWLGHLPAGTPLRISVNLSARQFQHAGLVDEVAQALHDTGLEPHRLQFEITESVVMHSASSALATLQKLKRLGVQLAIDDFGTGYSSLSYLKHFPVDTLKIDRTFVECLGQDGANAAIAQAIITLAQTLRMHTVAEGVETHAQHHTLHALGCEFGQGFFWAQPLPHAAAFVLLEDSMAAKALSVAG